MLSPQSARLRGSEQIYQPVLVPNEGHKRWAHPCLGDFSLLPEIMEPELVFALIKKEKPKQSDQL